MVLPYLGSDPSKLDEDPYWALDRAAGRGDLDALKSLVSQRLSDPAGYPDLTHDLRLPLKTATKNCNLPLVSYLLDEGAQITSQVVSSAAYPSSGVKADAIPVFRLFKERGWDVNAEAWRGGHKGNPVFFSSLTDETLARWFLDNGIDVTTIRGASRSLTPLTHAAYCSTPAVVSLLLSRGATLDHRVLQNAIRGHDDDDAAAFAMFDFFLQQDPSLALSINEIDTQEHPMCTRLERRELDHGAPLHWAVWKGRKSRVEFLIKKGAEVGVKTPKKGLTPADWARILGNEGLIDLFAGIKT